MQKLVNELILSNDRDRITKELFKKIDFVSLSDKFNFECQNEYFHLINLINIVEETKEKPISFTKMCLFRYAENPDLLWNEIIKVA